MAVTEAELTLYSRLNCIAEVNSAVFFGANCLSSLPVNELRQDFKIKTPVYNRSIRGLCLRDAEKYLNECIYTLNPQKIFVNLGDADLEQPDFNLQEFLSGYEWLLYTLHSHCRARIYIVSVVSADPRMNEVNSGLRKLAVNAGCDYIDINSAAASQQCEIEIFERFRYYLHSQPIDFADAFML